MARSNYKPAGPKADHIQETTDKIVAALESGVAPWVCPWDRSVGFPRNGHSGRQYNGINVVLLWLSGYHDARWYTYKQVSEGGYGASHVKRGEKGTKIVFWQFIKKTETDETTGEDTQKVIPFCRAFTVFNHMQIEWEAGKEPGANGGNSPVDPATEFNAAAEYFEAVGASVTHGGGTAAYSKAPDEIYLPPAAAFNSAADYWATRSHETVHWTGHKSRCDRDMTGRFGDEAYAAEELVAEMGSAFLCAFLGVKGKLQHASYLAHWIKILKGDKYAIFTAARKAKEAIVYLDTQVGVESVPEETDDEAPTMALAA